MTSPEDYETGPKENVHEEGKYNMIEAGDLPLEKLLKLSESFKTGVDRNLYKFKEENMTMINEMSDIMGCCTSNASCDNEDSKKTTINNSETPSSLDILRERENIRNCEMFSALQQESKNLPNSLDVQLNGNEFRPKPKKEECCIHVSSVQDKIRDTTSSFNEKSNYIKKIFEIENKCRNWMDKYDELHDKYLRLESKCVHIEKDNCSYQMEIARVKIIEDENLRLNQTIDKSNRVRKELESALESCHEVIYKYQNEVEVARNKVKEAVEMVEKTCSEKEWLEADLNKSHDEIVRLGNEIKKLIPEAGAKVNLEVEKVKTMYKDKLHAANIDIEFLRTENQIACNKAQQMTREYEILNKKYTSINQKHANEPNAYSKKVALIVQQIEEYEITFKSLISNVETLKETNRKLQDSYARKKTKYMMEITFLKNTTKSLETHLNRAINEISEYNIHIVEATDKTKSLEMEISKLKRFENNTEKKNMEINELIKYVEAQKQMVDMWRIEMNDMIEGFKHKINQLKKHCSQMNKKNIRLKQMINNSRTNNFKKKKVPNLQKNKRSYISSMSTST